MFVNVTYTIYRVLFVINNKTRKVFNIFCLCFHFILQNLFRLFICIQLNTRYFSLLITTKINVCEVKRCIAYSV